MVPTLPLSESVKTASSVKTMIPESYWSQVFVTSPHIMNLVENQFLISDGPDHVWLFVQSCHDLVSGL